MHPKHHISGSSLVEVTVSLLLVSISFLAAWMIYGYVVSSSAQRLTRTAEAQAEAWLANTLLEENFTADQREFDWGQMERVVSSHPDHELLVQVQILAFRVDGKPLADVNQWVYVAE